MARQLPKNVRQIGNVNDTPKIYVEDYVDTFFTQLCEKAGEETVGAFLIGDFQKTDEEEYVYIYGAIQMHTLTTDGTEFVLSEETWKRAYEDCKQYFEDGEMLGWFIARPGAVLKLEKNIVKLHRKSFPKKNTVFILKDSIEKEELYYVHKFNDLLPIGGHYTYYEKNPCMQNYMISTRKKNGASPTETVEDRVAKDFRGVVRLREERLQQKKTARAMYSFSACLVLIVVIMGVVTMNNYDKMKSVQKSLDSLTGVASAEKNDAAGDKMTGVDGNSAAGEGAGNSADDGPVLEANGNVTAVIGGEESRGGNDTSNTQETSGATTGQAGAEQIQGTENGQPQDTEGAGADTAMGQGSESPGENGSDGVYVVEKGDTLAMISRKIYGDISHVEAICKMNGLEDGNLIFVGQKLVLP